MKKKKDEITIRSSAAEYLTYVASVGDQQDSIEMRYEDENIWLTQKMMATLYDVGTNTINYHIKKIFEDSELQEDSVIRKFRITAADGKSYSTNHYSLEMIIAVGFKVNSERAVQFRKWVNQIAKDYTIKGWVMDDERLKNGGSVLTTEYFDRLLEQIREIRLSERRFYQKITDIYATALDYDRTAKTTKQFFAKVQAAIWIAECIKIFLLQNLLICFRKQTEIADNFICMDQERIEGFRDAFEPGEIFRWEIPKKEKAYKFQRIFRS